VNPESSNDANLFPGMTQKWGLLFDIQHRTGRPGRSAGEPRLGRTVQHLLLADPNKRVTGTIMTQLLPFADDKVLKLFAKFESGLYALSRDAVIRKVETAFPKRSCANK